MTRNIGLWIGFLFVVCLICICTHVLSEKRTESVYFYGSRFSAPDKQKKAFDWKVLLVTPLDKKVEITLVTDRVKFSFERIHELSIRSVVLFDSKKNFVERIPKSKIEVDKGLQSCEVTFEVEKEFMKRVQFATVNSSCRLNKPGFFSDNFDYFSWGSETNLKK